MHIVLDGRVWENDSFSTINKNLACALHRLGYDVRLEAWEQGRDKPHRHTFIDRVLLDELARRPKDYETSVTIRQSWPRCDPHYSERYNWDTIQGQRKIGLLPWESEHLPAAWLENMQKVDAIMAISPFSAERMQRELEGASIRVPVWSVPLGVDRRLFNPLVRPASLADARTFRFLHLGVGQPRKGSDLLRAAYLAEFTDSDDVTLVVKTGGWDSVKAWTDDLPAHAPHMLVIHDDNIPESNIGGFYTACDCLVHPARLEGFGLTMLEAMACGTPVICTEQGAHRVFANEMNAELVDCTEELFGFYQEMLGTAHRADHLSLRKAMRTEVSEDRSSRIEAGLHTAEAFSWSRCASHLSYLIERAFGPLERA